MTTYANYKIQIAELQKQAELARREEIAAVTANIFKIMGDYGLTLADLSANQGKQKKPRAAVPAKYRDPATGAEWSGRGRPPTWLNGKNKEAFRIK